MGDGRRFYEAPASGARRSAPAALRNREPIASVLEEWLPPTGVVLEIASGTGEHATFFADRFPNLEWQPSDVHPDALESIAAWRLESGLANVREPLWIDASCPADWPIERADAVLSINMVHISPWASALGLLDGAARVLLVEDLTTDGRSKVNFCKALREAGAKVDHVLVFFFYDIYPEARQIISDLGVTLHSLATWWDVLAVAKAGGKFDAAKLAEVEKFMHDPAGWSKAHGGVSAAAAE